MSHPDDDPPPWVDHAPLHPSDADWTTDDDQWYRAWAEIEQRSAERWLRFWVGAARRWRWMVWFDLAWILWGVVFAVYDLATGHPWFAGIIGRGHPGQRVGVPDGPPASPPGARRGAPPVAMTAAAHQASPAPRRCSRAQPSRPHTNTTTAPQTPSRPATTSAGQPRRSSNTGSKRQQAAASRSEE